MGQRTIYILGDSYSDESLFLSDIEKFKAELFIRLRHRQSQFNIIPLSWNNHFNCKDSGFFDGGTFNQRQVSREVAKWKLTKPYALGIAASETKGGSGGSIFMWGTTFHDQLHSGQTGLHEYSHSDFLGDAHDGGFMNGGGTDGAAGLNMTFNVAQFAKINQVLNQYAGILPSPQPFVSITSPLNGYSTATSFQARAYLAGGIQHVDIYFAKEVAGKTIPIHTLMCWERNTNCSMQNGISLTISPQDKGTHTLKMVATDYNNQSSEDTIQINIL